MLDKLKQLIGITLIIGTPYLLVGVISTTHAEHLRNMHGPDLVVSFPESIVSWPVLTISDVCMT
jgi:hypothetical protein